MVAQQKKLPRPLPAQQQQPNPLKNRTFTSDMPYAEVLAQQEQAVADIINGGPETLFIGEHPALYTCGTSSQDTDIIEKTNIPIIKTGRGGKVTYHGPGQIVAYPILDLKTRGRDIKQHVCNLQKWMIQTLEKFDISATTDDDVGVWVGDEKIAAIGVRVRRWVAFHGVALNVRPDMTAYKAIVPCGLKNKGVTSMEKQGCTADIRDVQQCLLDTFGDVF